MKLTKYQTTVRKVASVARRCGFAVIVDDSQSTESSYCTIGRLNDRGGFITLLKFRCSGHNVPGWSRSGWIMPRLYDLRINRLTKHEVKTRLAAFIVRLNQVA